MPIEFYRQNRAYAERLRDSDPREFQSLPSLCGAQPFHKKYTRALAQDRTATDIILDIGCGAGQVVRALCEAGLNAHGVDVSEDSIAIARAQAGNFQVYDGRALPFADKSVAAAGAFNVLEHVDDPVAFLDEMSRVLQPGGRLVVSSPNFLRALGWRDYHPRMRGIGQKWRNAAALLRRSRLYAREKETVVFEKMPLIHRNPPQPDDDAIVATNAVDIRQYLRTRGYSDISISCVDRPVPRWMEWILDATPLRLAMLNCFVTAAKTHHR